MDGDLRLLVMRHFHVLRRGHSCDAAPLGNAARDRRIDIENIHGSGFDQVAAAITGDLTLAGVHGNSALLPDPGEPLQLVVPDHWLLDPADIVIAHGTAEFDGLIRGPPLVGVTRDDEAGTRDLAREAYTFGVVFRREAAYLELDTRETDALVTSQLFRELLLSLSLDVVTAYGNHGDALAIPAQHAVE